jgi:hypothetical protein
MAFHIKNKVVTNQTKKVVVHLSDIHRTGNDRASKKEIFAFFLIIQAQHSHIIEQC